MYSVHYAAKMDADQSQFMSIILETFGYTALKTQYMQMPGNGVHIVSLLLGGWIASRWPGMRCVVMIVGNLICVACGGVLVGLSADHTWVGW